MNKGFPLPNYTQVPNYIIDEWMSKLSHAEFKIIMLIVRYTCGYHRREAEISMSHFQNKCNLSREHVNNSIKKFIELGWISVKKGDPMKSNTYEILLSPQEDSNKDEVVNSVDQGSQLSGLGVVNSVDHNKERDINKNKKEFVADDPVGSPPEKIQIKKGDSNHEEVTQSDVFRLALVKKKKWDTEEILYAWNVLCSYDNIVYDWFRFIEGTIEKYRNTSKGKYATKVKVCKTKNTQESFKEECSEKDTSGQRYPNSGALLMKLLGKSPNGSNPQTAS